MIDYPGGNGGYERLSWVIRQVNQMEAVASESQVMGLDERPLLSSRPTVMRITDITRLKPHIVSLPTVMGRPRRAAT